MNGADAAAGEATRASCLRRLERGLDRLVGGAVNPLRQLGALAFHLFWVVTASGIVLYVFYDTGVDAAYRSVAELERSVPGAALRTLHRHASDAFLVVVLLHLLVECCHGRFRHFRRFTWLSGVPTLWLTLIAGIVGFAMVWDALGGWVAVSVLEWLARLPLIDPSMVRNVIVGENLSNRFFSLLVFLHIGVSLALLGMMWVHVQRLAHPLTRPTRASGVAIVVALVVMALAAPAPLHAPADPSRLTGPLALDWFYLGVLVPASRAPASSWAVAAIATALLCALPWLGRVRRTTSARVTLADCNGCGRCFADCPYEAIALVPRSDGARHPLQASVRSALCAGCGICAGSCPSATPFRSMRELRSGIDLPERPVSALREELLHALDAAETATKIVVFACAHGARGPTPAPPGVHRVTLLCSAQLPPAFIGYALRRGAGGVVLAGCADAECEFRLGARYAAERLAGRREPHARRGADDPHVLEVRAGRGEEARLRRAIEAFCGCLGARAPTTRVGDAHG